MKNNLIAMVLAFAVSSAVIIGCGGGDTAGNVVARYEGGTLTVDDLDAHYDRIKKTTVSSRTRNA